ncbi:C-terminal helicase domain-containing protein [Cereibacter sphaeroides]|uniref:C-terminal helicase domain-containing protein n=1 Tax=Cereibacter sphaeroides TaxID=1063 RepID=UPI000AB8E26B|nr:helicase C-terminal domain-containing protein [Cereibacter sphaeroides]
MVISVRSVEGLERDKLYRVTSTLPYQNSITLRPEGGGAEVALTLDMGRKLRDRSPHSRWASAEFAAGDEVKFRDHGQVIAERLTVRAGRITKVTEAQIDVHAARRAEALRAHGFTRRRGLDHAYAATAHDFQGATVDRIIVGMTPDEQLTSQKSFYVNISARAGPCDACDDRSREAR